MTKDRSFFASDAKASAGEIMTLGLIAGVILAALASALGAMLFVSNPLVRSLVARFGKTWWRVFVAVSSNGFIRVNSLHQRSRRAIAREISAAGRAIEEIADLEER